MLCTHGKVPCEHEQRKRDESQLRKVLGQALVVLRKAAQARYPPRNTVQSHAPGKQHESPRGLRQPYRVQHDAAVGGTVLGLPAGAAPIDIRKRDVPAEGALHGVGRAYHLGTVLFVCRRPERRQKVDDGIDGNVHLRPHPALCAVVSALWPPSAVLWGVRLSMTKAVSSGPRSAASRRSSRVRGLWTRRRRHGTRAAFTGRRRPIAGGHSGSSERAPRSTRFSAARCGSRADRARAAASPLGPAPRAVGRNPTRHP